MKALLQPTNMLCRLHQACIDARAAMEFEWPPEKAAANLAKHELNFETATRVFFDPLLLEIRADDDHGEMRYSVVGLVEGRLLHVTYTMRGHVYRIISARAAERHERRKYHAI